MEAEALKDPNATPEPSPKPKKPRKPRAKKKGSESGKIFWGERFRVYARDWFMRAGMLLNIAAAIAYQFYQDNKDAIHATVPIAVIAIVVIFIGTFTTARPISQIKAANNAGEEDEK